MHFALKYAIAMSSGNADEVRSYFLATGAQEQTVADAYAGLASSVRRLQEVAQEKFGEHGFELIGFGRMFTEEVARIRSSKAVEKGNEARLYVGGNDKSPLVLIFVNGDWKISVTRSYPKNQERRILRIHAQSGAYNELAAEIKKGMYASADAAREAGRQKVAQAMSAAEAELSKNATTRNAQP
jgi:hypothetical protein